MQVFLLFLTIKNVKYLIQHYKNNVKMKRHADILWVNRQSAQFEY